MVSMAAFALTRGQKAPTSAVSSPSSEAAFRSGRAQGRFVYTAGEDAKIVNFLKNLKSEQVVSRNRLYHDISRQVLGSRHSWESVKNRVSRSILPKLAFLVDNETRERICKLLKPTAGTPTSSSTSSESTKEESRSEKDEAEKEEEKGEEEKLEEEEISGEDKEVEEEKEVSPRSSASEDSQQSKSSSENATILDSLGSEDPLSEFFALTELHGLDRAEAVALLWMSSDQPVLASRLLRRRENPTNRLWTPEEDERLTSGVSAEVTAIFSKFGEEAAAVRLRFLEGMAEPVGGPRELAFVDV